MNNGSDMGNVPQLIANLDAVALLRETSRSAEPDPVQAAAIVEAAGVAGVAVHLREDRRYIQDRDVRLLKETVKSSFNLTISPTEGLLAITEALKPDQVTLIPSAEASAEVGDQDLADHDQDLRGAVEGLQRAGMRVGLVVQPDLELIKQAAGLGAQAISLHLKGYANAADPSAAEQELEALRNAADYARKLGLRVRAAGGVHVRNCEPLFEIESIHEHELGHGLMARAVLIGLGEAVRELIGLMRAARSLVPQYRA
jgi:pyridoxine 5-phosphate synthase